MILTVVIIIRTQLGSSLSSSLPPRQSPDQSHYNGDEGHESREGRRAPEGYEGHEEVKSLIFAGKNA